MSLTETVAGGDRKASLVALRDRLAADLDECQSARDVSSLSQRLMDVLAQIELLEKAAPVAEGTALDELANRRKAAGRSDASGAVGSTVRPQRGR